MLGSNDDVGFEMAPPRTPGSIKYGAILREWSKLGGRSWLVEVVVKVVGLVGRRIADEYWERIEE